MGRPPSEDPCASCGGVVSKKSKSGFCRSCYLKQRPAWEGRTCAQCEERPSGKYLRCKSCRAQGEKVPCRCGGLKTPSAEQCRECRWREPRFGPDHPAWKGGRIID